MNLNSNIIIAESPLKKKIQKLSRKEERKIKMKELLVKKTIDNPSSDLFK